MTATNVGGMLVPTCKTCSLTFSTNLHKYCSRLMYALYRTVLRLTSFQEKQKDQKCLPTTDVIMHHVLSHWIISKLDLLGLLARFSLAVEIPFLTIFVVKYDHNESEGLDVALS